MASDVHSAQYWQERAHALSRVVLDLQERFLELARVLPLHQAVYLTMSAEDLRKLAIRIDPLAGFEDSSQPQTGHLMADLDALWERVSPNGPGVD